MRIAKGDYLVIGIDSKKHLMRALTDVSDKTFEAVSEKMCHIQALRNTATMSTRDVVLNLGPNPAPGKVYGLDVSSLFCGRKVHDDIGTIQFFYKPDKQVVADLWAAFSKVNKILGKRGLDFLLRDISWEVIPHNGEKYAGMFTQGKGEKTPRRIQLRPDSLPATEFTYLILHEVAHNMHFNFVTSKKLNALWIRLFNTSIKPVSVTKEMSKSLLESMLSQEDVPSAFKGQLNEEQALAFKWVTRTISQVSQISLKELDTLFEADMRDDIKALWPIRTLHHKDLAPIVTAYATKSHKELFAESMAFHLTGKKLPEPITRLVEKTISHAKSNQEG